MAGGGTRTPGTSAEGGPAIEVKLTAPRNVAVDPDGVLYVSDFANHRVYRVMPTGVFTTFAGRGVAGSAGDGGAATQAELNAPTALGLDSIGTLYIGESGSKKIRKITRGIITSIPLAGPYSVLYGPVGMAADSSGNLYVADARQDIFRVSTAGMTTRVISQPARDLALDASGNLYLADGPTVRRVTPQGTAAVIAGSGQIGYAGDGNLATSARLLRPYALAFDGSGTLYIADEGTGRLRKVNASGTMTTVALGFRGPQGVTVDPLGNVFVADTENHQVKRITPGGVLSTEAGPDLLQFPGAVLTDPQGGIYVADTGNHKIRKLSSGGISIDVAGAGTPGNTGDSGPATAAQLNTPRALALDKDSNLFIADTGNNSVRKVTPSGIITTVVSGLAFPRGIAVAPNGDLLVSEADGHVVRRVSGGSAVTAAGSGIAGFAGDDGPAIQARLRAPAGLAVDQAGNVFIADLGNARVRKLEPSSGGGPAPITELAVVHAATNATGPVAPGQLVSLFGENIGPASPVGALLTPNGTLATVLANTEVRVNGEPAPLLYAGRNQVNLQIPFTVAGRPTAEIEAVVRGAVVARTVIPVAAAAPGLFTLGGGAGQVVAINEDGSINSRDNAALRGSVVVLYATGEGAVTPDIASGKPAAAPFPRPQLPVELTIAGRTSELQWAGSAPGFVGLMQLNARVPAGFAPTGELEVVLSVGGLRSPGAVMLWVR